MREVFMGLAGVLVSIVVACGGQTAPPSHASDDDGGERAAAPGAGSGSDAAPASSSAGTCETLARACANNRDLVCIRSWSDAVTLTCRGGGMSEASPTTCNGLRATVRRWTESSFIYLYDAASEELVGVEFVVESGPGCIAGDVSRGLGCEHAWGFGVGHSSCLDAGAGD